MAGPTLDCCGLSCPLPVIRVKEALEKGKKSFAIRVDEAIAVENISRFLGSRGIPFTISKDKERTLIMVGPQN